MAFSNAEGACNEDGTGSSTATITHGISLASGDLLSFFVSTNDTGAISSPGAGWNEEWEGEMDDINSGETGRMGWWTKTSDGTETTVSASLAGSTTWACIFHKVEGSGTYVEDLAVNTGFDGSGFDEVIVEAADGRTVAADGYALVYGAMDNRYSPNNTYDSVDQSYEAPTGCSDGQQAAGAVRIDAGSGHTISGDVTISFSSGFGADDVTMSLHKSFVESGGGGGGGPFPYHAVRQQRKFNKLLTM